MTSIIGVLLFVTGLGLVIGVPILLWKSFYGIARWISHLLFPRSKESTEAKVIERHVEEIVNKPYIVQVQKNDRPTSAPNDKKEPIVIHTNISSVAVKCPNCGAAYRPDAKYCEYCGAKIDIPEINVIHTHRHIDEAKIRRQEMEKERLQREHEEKVLQLKIAEEKARNEKEKQRTDTIMKIIVLLVRLCLIIIALVTLFDLIKRINI